MNIRVEVLAILGCVAVLAILAWVLTDDKKTLEKPLCICPTHEETPTVKEKYADPVTHEWVERVLRESIERL